MRLDTELCVHLDLLNHNYGLLKKIAPKNDVIFMVKANAYGHGILEIVHFSFTELGIKRFGCASLGEALEIRRAFPTLECELWVFSDSNLNLSQVKEYYLDLNIIPVLHNMEDLELILNDRDFEHMPLVLKFDTGMNRLGLHKKDIEQIVSKMIKGGRKELLHVLTHFANSYIKLKPKDKTQRQYKEFKEILEALKAAGISIEETSCSNSGAIEQSFGLDESHIRPGLMMYGPKSVYNSEVWNGKTISTFKTKIIKIEPIKKGMPIGYGSHTCGHNGFIVYLPVGYGDGILTYYSGREITLHEKAAKIIGRVNMDLTAIFFEELPDKLTRGSVFSFWNDKNYSVTDLSAQLSTTQYQLFTAITNRVPRRYLK
ncbi:MAG: alanine racemase [Bacteriovoracaceae bacterium]|jgi:alanine racemase